MAQFVINAGSQKMILLCSFLVLLSLLSCSHQSAYPPAAQVGANIVIDVSSLAPGEPKFFTYRHNGKNINYFALKINGKVSSFLDACASCYTHKKGYRYDDGAVICRFCNMKYPVFKLEQGLGGCYPIKIEGRMENGNYLISQGELQKHTGKF